MADAKIRITAEDKTKAAFKSAERNLAGFKDGIGGLNGRLTALLGAAGITAAINKSLEFADTLSELAKRTGMTTRATQELQFAFIQSGSNAKAYETVMGKFVQTLGDAANGSQQAVDALKRVGITQEDLKNQSVEQLYVRTSDAISKMTASTERASVANDIFGKSYKDAANAIGLSRQELDDMRKMAQATGAVLAEDVIRNAKRAKDEMEQWSRVINVQLAEAFIGFGPILVRSAKFLADFAQLAKAALQSLGLIDRITNQDKRDSILASLNNVEAQLRESREAMESSTLFPEAQKKRYSADIAALDARKVELLRELDTNRQEFLKQQAFDKQGGPGAAGPAATRIVDTSSDKAFEALNARTRKRLETLQTGFLTEQEQEKFHLSERQRIIEEAWVFEQISIEERNRLKEEAELQHQAKLGDIFAQGELARRQFQQSSLMQQLTTVQGGLGLLSQLMQSQNKKLFEIGKKAAAGEAAIATASGAIKAYQAMAGIPIIGPALGIAAAAALTAFGAERVRAILSTPFGGGVAAGGSASVSASTGFPTGSIGGGDFPAQQQPRQRDTVIIYGLDPDKIFSGQQMRDLIERQFESESTGVSFA